MKKSNGVLLLGLESTLLFIPHSRPSHGAIEMALVYPVGIAFLHRQDTQIHPGSTAQASSLPSLVHAEKLFDTRQETIRRVVAMSSERYAPPLI